MGETPGFAGLFFLHMASDRGRLFVLYAFPLKGLSPQQKGLSPHRFEEM
jgi:hypothetical protein